MVGEDDRTGRDSKIKLIRERSTTTVITDWKPLVDSCRQKKLKEK